ncbi:MAG: hypothetical protein Q9M50_10235 [Methylococcales bacterium]|nr:hypothetical protein [Methylococcales bacterium]
MVDNASVHTRQAFLEKHDDWMGQGLGLPLDCYLRYEHLKKSVLEILDNFGKKYLITFV